MDQETEKNFVPISVTIQPELLAMLDKVCEGQHINRSECLRRGFGLYLKQLVKEEPLPSPAPAGVYVDGSGTLVHVGLLCDADRARVASGEWKLVKAF
jgi:hypothetical protein